MQGVRGCGGREGAGVRGAAERGGRQSAGGGRVRGAGGRGGRQSAGGGRARGALGVPALDEAPLPGRFYRMRVIVLADVGDRFGAWHAIGDGQAS